MINIGSGFFLIILLASWHKVELEVDVPVSIENKIRKIKKEKAQTLLHRFGGGKSTRKYFIALHQIAATGIICYTTKTVLWFVHLTEDYQVEETEAVRNSPAK